MPLSELLMFVLVVAGVILAYFIVIYATKRHGKREEKPSQESFVQPRVSPFKLERSVVGEEAERARDELRILDLEREILSTAIRRLYEAHAEGKISEEEREKIAQAYKSRMMTIKDAISKDESLVALHELEAMQGDLVKLFTERFDELNMKIGELRSKVEVEPIKEIAIPRVEKPSRTPSATRTKQRKKKKPAAKPSPRSEAEKRIEKIREEVEKVLDKLGQMEIET